MKTNIFYKDIHNNLRSLSTGDSQSDLQLVKDQGSVVADIIALDMPAPTTVVLCAIEGGKV